MSRRHQAHGTASGADEDGIESRDAGLVSSLGRVAQILLRPELKRWRPIMGIAPGQLVGKDALLAALPGVGVVGGRA